MTCHTNRQTGGQTDKQTNKRTAEEAGEMDGEHVKKGGSAADIPRFDLSLLGKGDDWALMGGRVG